MSVNVVLNCLMIQNCMEVFGDKKGCDDMGGVWDKVGVWWDLKTEVVLQKDDFRKFFD